MSDEGRPIYVYLHHTCYDMDVGENRVRVFYGTEKREGKEKDSRYMDETSAPAAVTVYQICNISPAQVYL
jgi:hypothetical protein